MTGGQTLRILGRTASFALYWLVASVALMLPPSALCARLVVVPLSSDSHISATTALTTQLEALGGHEVYMVVSDTLLESSKAMATARNPQHNHHYLTYPFDFSVFSSDMGNIATANPIAAIAIGYRILAAMTEMVISNAPLLQQISELQPDMIIGDAAANYGHFLTALTGVPSLEFDVGTSSGIAHSLNFGGQLHPGYIPATGTFYPSTGMTLLQRSINVAATVAVKAMMYICRTKGPIGRLARRYSNGYLPGTGPYRPLLLLVNFDWALEPARPVAPSTVYVGALMPKPAAPLPEDIRTWLDGGSNSSRESSATSSSPKPAVYISFGSSFLAPEEFMPAVARAVNVTVKHMRFLLRLRQQEQEAWEAVLQRLDISLLPDQVFIRGSYPQNDLLGHQAVAAFVTQGGYLSMQEAGFHGVPVIGVPFTMGQGELAQHAEDHGRGVVVHKEGLMRGDPKPLIAALMAVVTNGTFKQQAALTSIRMKAHPRSSGQQATDWVNYALTIANASQTSGPTTNSSLSSNSSRSSSNSGISFLHTQGQDMTWWQVLLLDVLLLYITAVAGAAVLLVKAWQLLRRGLMVRPAGRPGGAADGRVAGGDGSTSSGKDKHA